MNNYSHDTKSLKLLYFRYKDSKLYGIFIFLIILCIGFLLVWTVVLPEVQKYISIQDEVDALSKKVSLLHKNLDIVKSSDPDEVTDHFQTALAGLPADKDFEGILYAISASALRSGVALGDFRMSIGKLATESGKPITGIPIKLTLKTDVATSLSFITELNQKVPISDISIADITEDDPSKGTSIDYNFYYKPLSDVVFHDDAPIPQISTSQKELLEKIKVWKENTYNNDDLNFIASASAALR